MKKRLKKWTFEKFWAHFEVLYYKQSSEFVIPTFHDYSLDPKIRKCGDPCILKSEKIGMYMYWSASY